MSKEMDPEAGWQIQPEPGDVDYDLDEALSCLVTLRAQIPEDGLTAPVLGTERAGNGVIIDPRGLVLTIGYLITEAVDIWVTDNNGRSIQATVAAYDQVTGFGLVQTFGSLDLPALALGDSSEVQPADRVVVAGGGGIGQAINALVTARREFAGYWEYVLDEAMFTAPAHPNWGGAAMIDADGQLVAVGSLLVQQLTQSGETIAGNMMVPTDLLKPILEDLKTHGRARRTPRPWLGMLVRDDGEDLAVGGLYDEGPSQVAGARSGDLIVRVAGSEPASLADFFRRVWAIGPAGAIIPITVMRDGKLHELNVASIDRDARLKHGQVH